MPENEKHLQQYRHNKDFVQKGINDTMKFSDWYVVGLFYCAVHLMEAYLSKLNMHSGSHSDRAEILRKHVDSDTYINYQCLYNMSIKARYTCIDINNNDTINSQSALDGLENFYGKKYL